VLTTQTSSSPFDALSVATGASADGDAWTPVAQQHTTAITVRARESLSAAKRRKTDTERMEDQPVPQRGRSSTVLNSSTRFRASEHVFRRPIMASARPVDRESRSNRYVHASSARSLSRAATGREIFWRNRFACPTVLRIVS
jgi:hypothetical protein